MAYTSYMYLEMQKHKSYGSAGPHGSDYWDITALDDLLHKVEFISIGRYLIYFAQDVAGHYISLNANIHTHFSIGRT